MLLTLVRHDAICIAIVNESIFQNRLDLLLRTNSKRLDIGHMVRSLTHRGCLVWTARGVVGSSIHLRGKGWVTICHTIVVRRLIDHTTSLL